jgi:hypothetical protein
MAGFGFVTGCPQDLRVPASVITGLDKQGAAQPPDSAFPLTDSLSLQLPETLLNPLR